MGVVNSPVSDRYYVDSIWYKLLHSSVLVIVAAPRLLYIGLTWLNTQTPSSPLANYLP